MCCMAQHLCLEVFSPALPDSLLIQQGAGPLEAFALGQLVNSAECIYSTVYFTCCVEYGHVSIML